MGYTSFGELMRKLRIKHHEVMGDVAKMLSVTTPFLSAVETGKKNVPESWFELIVKHYDLNTEEQSKLCDAIEASKTQMKLNLIGSSNYKREMALQFQRSFNEIDEETAKKIIELLNSKEGDE